MSQENVEIVRRVYEGLQGVDVVPVIRATLEGDVSAISPELVDAQAVLLRRFDPNVEIDTSGLDMPGFGIFRGLEGLRELWSGWIEGWDHYSWTCSNYSEVGGHVVYDVEIRATGRSSGADVIWNHCHALTFRDGKIIRWSFFKDRTSACRDLEAVGLPEQDAHADS